MHFYCIINTYNTTHRQYRLHRQYSNSIHTRKCAEISRWWILRCTRQKWCGNAKKKMHPQWCNGLFNQDVASSRLKEWANGHSQTTRRWVARLDDCDTNMMVSKKHDSAEQQNYDCFINMMSTTCANHLWAKQTCVSEAIHIWQRSWRRTDDVV